jgi:hypothetical protein
MPGLDFQQVRERITMWDVLQLLDFECRSRFLRVPVSRFDRLPNCVKGGWSAAISRLRILEIDGDDGEALADVESGWIEG